MSSLSSSSLAIHADTTSPRLQLQRRRSTIRRCWSPRRSSIAHVSLTFCYLGFLARKLISLLRPYSNVLNFLKVQKIDLAKLTETMSLDQVKEHLCEIVDECVQKAQDLQEKTGFIVLERGFA